MHILTSSYIPVGHVDEQVLLFKNVPIGQAVQEVDVFWQVEHIELQLRHDDPLLNVPSGHEVRHWSL